MVGDCLVLLFDGSVMIGQPKVVKFSWLLVCHVFLFFNHLSEVDLQVVDLIFVAASVAFNPVRLVFADYLVLDLSDLKYILRLGHIRMRFNVLLQPVKLLAWLLIDSKGNLFISC